MLMLPPAIDTFMTAIVLALLFHSTFRYISIIAADIYADEPSSGSY